MSVNCDLTLKESSEPMKIIIFGKRTCDWFRNFSKQKSHDQMKKITWFTFGSNCSVIEIPPQSLF